MKRLCLSIIITTISIIASFGADFIGVWRGNLKVGTNNLLLVFHINADSTATIDSPLQGAKDLPCNKPIISGDSIIINMPMLHASYKGEMQPDGKSINGTFRQGIELPLILTATTADAATIIRPQTPTPPYPYIAEDVTFAHDSITLAGTLTTPVWRKRHPAVILVSGSGAQDRDETILEHRPFAVIADHLTRAGIAVLRYDDRGKGGSSAGTPDDTTFDFAKDTEAAIEFLKRRPDIDPEHIGIIGHSEGGLIAMIVAAACPNDVDFIVSLAGSAIKGKDQLITQNLAICRLNGTPLSEAEIAQLHDQFNAIDTISDRNKLTSELRIILTRSGTTISPQHLEQSINLMTSKWYTTFIRFDPTETLRAVHCPVLALNGDWDFQVDAEANLNAISDAIPNATVIKYPRLNHLFQESATMAESFDYGTIQQTIAPQVLDDITSWIHSTIK